MERSIIEAQAQLTKTSRCLDYTDSLVASQRMIDRTRAITVMETIRRDLMSVRSESQARALADCIFVDPSAARFRSAVVSVATDLFRMLRSSAESLLVRVVHTAGERSSAHPDGTLDIAENDRSQIWHELGHFVELATPSLYEAAVDWRRARALHSGQTGRPVALNELAPEVGYEPDEYAIEDAFYSIYVGATYEQEGLGSTEVFSTGIEWFDDAELMIELYQQDPEHFMFVVGALVS